MFLNLLVVAQIALAAGLVLSSTWWPIPWASLCLASPGIVLAGWAWIKMGLTILRIRRTTTDETRLITDGPYGMVRHPMYTGLLWFTAALLISGFAWWRLVAWLILLEVLQAKVIYEERAMSDQFEDYKAYCQRVGRLIPMVRSAAE